MSNLVIRSLLALRSTFSPEHTAVHIGLVAERSIVTVTFIERRKNSAVSKQSSGLAKNQCPVGRVLWEWYVGQALRQVVHRVLFKGRHSWRLLQAKELIVSFEVSSTNLLVCLWREPLKQARISTQILLNWRLSMLDWRSVAWLKEPMIWRKCWEAHE